MADALSDEELLLLVVVELVLDELPSLDELFFDESAEPLSLPFEEAAAPVDVVGRLSFL